MDASADEGSHLGLQLIVRQLPQEPDLFDLVVAVKHMVPDACRASTPLGKGTVSHIATLAADRFMFRTHTAARQKMLQNLPAVLVAGTSFPAGFTPCSRVIAFRFKQRRQFC